MKVPAQAEPSMDAPMPPMDDQFGMGEDLGPEPQPNDMGMGGDQEPAPAEGGSEIDSVFSQLDTEKQAAVLKYAKSMVNDNAGEEPKPDTNVEEEKIVTEITNNILNDRVEKKSNEKVRNKKITNANPFITKNFNKYQ